MCGQNNAIKHPWLGMVYTVYTSYNTGDDWGIVYGIVLPPLPQMDGFFHGESPSINGMR